MILTYPSDTTTATAAVVGASIAYHLPPARPSLPPAAHLTSRRPVARHNRWLSSSHYPWQKTWTVAALQTFTTHKFRQVFFSVVVVVIIIVDFLLLMITIWQIIIDRYEKPKNNKWRIIVAAAAAASTTTTTTTTSTTIINRTIDPTSSMMASKESNFLPGIMMTLLLCSSLLSVVTMECEWVHRRAAALAVATISSSIRRQNSFVWFHIILFWLVAFALFCVFSSVCHACAVCYLAKFMESWNLWWFLLCGYFYRQSVAVRFCFDAIIDLLLHCVSIESYSRPIFPPVIVCCRFE